jgi:hypothetical protein
MNESELRAITQPPVSETLDDRKLVPLIDEIVVDVLAAPNRKAAARSWVDTICLDVLPQWMNTTREWAAIGIMTPLLNYLMLVANGADAAAEQHLRQWRAYEREKDMPYFLAKTLEERNER